ncbi:MAG: signal peptidase I [Nitrospinaceae bacterium]
MTNKGLSPVSEPGVQKKTKTVFREYVEAIVIALLLALFIRTFVLQAFKIPSGSMKPTLQIGDHILVSKFAYGIHIPNEIPIINVKLFPDIILFSKNPKRGDIVVFKFPKDETRDFIKRVIGLPGDLLQVRSQRVYINNKLYEDPHAFHRVAARADPFVPRDDFGPVVVPEGYLFVMGDNRENSQDSRYWGFLDMTKVKGRALMIYWSWNAEVNWVRFDRIGKILE